MCVTISLCICVARTSFAHGKAQGRTEVRTRSAHEWRHGCSMAPAPCSPTPSLKSGGAWSQAPCASTPHAWARDGQGWLLAWFLARFPPFGEGARALPGNNTPTLVRCVDSGCNRCCSAARLLLRRCHCQASRVDHEAWLYTYTSRDHIYVY